MVTAIGLIEVERLGETLVLTPERNLAELEYEAIEGEERELLGLLAAEPSIRHVVADFRKTDYFGPTALNLLTLLSQAVRGRGGRLILCNLSAHEEEILQVTRLAGLWPRHASREEAIEAVAD